MTAVSRAESVGPTGESMGKQGANGAMGCRLCGAHRGARGGNRGDPPWSFALLEHCWVAEPCVGLDNVPSVGFARVPAVLGLVLWGSSLCRLPQVVLCWHSPGVGAAKGPGSGAGAAPGSGSRHTAGHRAVGGRAGGFGGLSLVC